MPKMTRYERLSVMLAGIALVLAVASPFVSYHWFQTSIKETNLKASGFKATATFKNYMALDPHWKRPVMVYKVSMSNDGPLSVGKVLLSFQRCCHDNFDQDITKSIEVSPPARYTVNVSGDTLLLSFDNAFPSKQESQVVLRNPWDQVDGTSFLSMVISSEATPPTFIPYQAENPMAEYPSESPSPTPKLSTGKKK
jgi:hypothetical protein